MAFEDISNKWVTLLDSLNEVQRRRSAALKALEIGRGGISKISRLAGISRDTIRKGIQEVNSSELKKPERLRKIGGGRKRIIDKTSKLRDDLEKIMNENTAGNPMKTLKWTNKSTYSIAETLKREGNFISEDTVGRILKEQEYSLQANKKSHEGKSHPDRDAQFHYINTQVEEFLAKKQPVISVDTKKRELVGNFKNQGKTWRKKGSPEEVNAYDFPNLSKGKAIPYGTYDIALNQGFVNVGIDSNTAEFAVESIRQWWKQLGKKHYPKAKNLLICADCGGGNGNRNHGWKYFLNDFSKETNLRVTILHFPPATSKWNKIEHRLFSFISKNWKGKPLINYEVIINFIKNTTTETGLKVYARLDRKKYKKGRKFSDKEMAEVSINPHIFHPEWNYTITQND